MAIDLNQILYNMTQGELTKFEFDYPYEGKVYHVKVYLVGKLIRIDIQEA